MKDGMAHEPYATEREHPEPARVLIVEDELVLSRWLQQVLLREGCEYQLAESATAAEQFLRDNPDWAGVVYVDLRLPDRSGLELIEEANRHRTGRPALRWILSSGHIEDETLSSLERLGADFLPKPFDADQFLRCVRDATRESD